MSNSKTFFYHEKPFFGLDIGFGSIKVMQLKKKGGKYIVQGYGTKNFDNSSIKNGEVVNAKSLADEIHSLLKKHTVGKITARRVALNIPSTRIFTRTMNLPPISGDELKGAVDLEFEQYVPAHIDSLYLDYNVIKQTKEGVELLAVATPRKVVDSYMQLFELMKLEPIAFDTSTSAAGRLFETQTKNNETPAILIDFGAISADVTIHDKTNIVTGTIACGGDIFTELIAKEMKIDRKKAHSIKSRYGLTKSKHQQQIIKAISPQIDRLVKEIKRMLRYYDERSGSNNSKIDQIVTMGGGANMLGLGDHLTSLLRLPVRMFDPWRSLDLRHLHRPVDTEKPMYVTAAGLAQVDTKELYKN